MLQVPWWEDDVEDVSPKGLKSQQVGAQASVLAVVVASATTRVVAMASHLPLIIVGTPAGIEGVTRVMVEAEMLMHQGHGARPTTSLCLVD